MTHTKERRKIINPNPAFRQQLVTYEGILSASRKKKSISPLPATEDQSELLGSPSEPCVNITLDSLTVTQVTSSAQVRENEEMVRSKQKNARDDKELKPLELIPQYDGADDLKLDHCEICLREFQGRNCVRNKKNHQLNHHFKTKIEEIIQAQSCENGEYLCNYSNCDFKSRRRHDLQLHLASKHQLLEAWLKEHSNNLPVMPGTSVQAVSEAEGQENIGHKVYESNAAEAVPVSTSLENLTQVKQ